MELSVLHAPILRVYLMLMEQRNQQDVCTLSNRQLSRLRSLSRNTVSKALHQLEAHGLVVSCREGWWIKTTPLQALSSPGGGSQGEPVEAESGSPSEPPTAIGGSQREPLDSEMPEMAPNESHSTPSPNARIRTLWSSSSEEDKEIVHPLSSSPRTPELVGESTHEETTEQGREEDHKNQDEFIGDIKALWDRIDSSTRPYPEPWFAKLKDEFGAEIPLAVFEQFIQSGRTLTDLNQPGAYQRYFATCCRNAPPPEEAPPPTDWANYAEDLEALYLAKRAKKQDELKQDMDAYHRRERRSA